MSAFKSGFAADKVQFRQLGSDLGAAIQGASSKTDSELAVEFGALSGRATQQAVQLRKLNPPSKFKNDLEQLATDFDTVATDLRSIANAASAHTVQAAKAATTTTVQDAAKLKSTDQSLTSKLGLPSTG